MQKKLSYLNHYFVILAGGKGERLWPLSRTEKPKQLLPFINKKSLLEHTVQRIEPLTSKDNIWIITNDYQVHAIEQLVSNNIGKIIAEPVSRNTAPAILLACLEIYDRDPQASITFLPADHYIPDEETFRNHATYIATYNNSSIILLGVRSQYAATGYGYIEYEKNSSEIIIPVIRFHEKPDRATAELYTTQKKFLWNIGIFSGSVSTFINEYKKYCPELLFIIKEYYRTKQGYDQCPNISFDHAILEKNNNCMVMPIDIQWSDVGNLETFLTLASNDAKQNNILSIDAHNNLISGTEKLVALIGVDDLCIVQTEDVLLIAKRSEVEQVKHAVTALKTNKQGQYL